MIVVVVVIMVDRDRDPPPDRGRGHDRGERWATTTSTMIGPAEGGGAQSLQTGQMGAGHLLWISTGRI